MLQALSEPESVMYMHALAPRALLRRGLKGLPGCGASRTDNRLRRLFAAGILSQSSRSVRLNAEPIKMLGRYFDVLFSAGSINQGVIVMDPQAPSETYEEEALDDLGQMLLALSDPGRRLVYERIVVRPGTQTDVAQSIGITRPAVSHHIRHLKACGLVYAKDGQMRASMDVLPRLRTYFDRLWIESTLGDAWLQERKASISDYGS